LLLMWVRPSRGPNIRSSTSGEVASEFNRYGSISVDIEDAELRVLPVSGMFDTGDTDSLVAFLQDPTRRQSR
jgi:ferric-dicitrate binding protein FerR (iron transport regulator)